MDRITYPGSSRYRHYLIRAGVFLVVFCILWTSIVHAEDKDQNESLTEISDAGANLYDLSLSEVYKVHETTGTGAIPIYEIPVGAVITLEARVEGIKQELTYYDSSNRKISGFYLSSTGKNIGGVETAAVGVPLIYTITRLDTTCHYITLDITYETSTETATDKYLFLVTMEEVVYPKSPVTKSALGVSPNLMVNGEIHEVSAYEIDGSNYFKLRDLAWLLAGTGSEFAVGWDVPTKSILLESGDSGLGPDDEPEKGQTSGDKTAITNNTQVYLDGVAVSAGFYEIDGYTYFNLRDLGNALNFRVGWNESTKTVSLEAEKRTADTFK